MMRFLYSLVTCILSVVISIRLLLTAKGRTRLKDRFGFWRKTPEHFVWFHGASVGEIKGLVPVVVAFKKKNATPIVVTVTSTTALEEAAKLTDHAYLLPFDSEPFISHAIENKNIKAFVVSETEVWPALYLYLKKKRIPIMVINGRLSTSSIGSYKMLKRILPDVFKAISSCFVVDELMRGRFLELLPGELITIAGNTKYEREPLFINKQEERQQFFIGNRPIVIIGNIRPGEEEIIFPVIKSSVNDYEFAIVPRHKEKFGYFIEGLHKYGVPQVLRSNGHRGGDGVALMVDTFGELERLYACADKAFIGGSLKSYGGHNPLEPAPYHVSVAIGPFTESTGDLVSNLIDVRAITLVTSGEEFQSFLRKDSNTDAENLFQFWQRQQGASDHIIERLEQFLGNG